MKNRNELPNFFKMPNMKVDTEKLLNRLKSRFQPSNIINIQNLNV